MSTLVSVLALAAVALTARSAEAGVELNLFGGGHYIRPHNSLGVPLNQQELKLNAFDPGGGVRLGFIIGWLHLEAEGAGAMAKLTATGGTGYLVSGKGHAMLRFGSRLFQPFLLAGAGVHTLFPQSGIRESLGYVDAGVGMYLRFGPTWGLRLDVRGVVPMTNFAVGSADGEAWLGLYKRFGMGGSGAAKEAPKPEPKADLEEEEETPKPKKRAKDSDGDGVPDDKDKAPDEPEDMDGFEDDDGVPDPDNDGDGVADGDDKCADEKENVNGYKDGDGCDDQVPSKVKAFTGTIKGITFANGKATIKKPSFKQLNKAVAMLEEFPEVKIAILGYTDDKGDEDKNIKLSQKRADAVKAYLVDKGIDESRIAAEGKGPADPVADNGTSKGREKNRRIEFKLVE